MIRSMFLKMGKMIYLSGIFRADIRLLYGFGPTTLRITESMEL